MYELNILYYSCNGRKSCGLCEEYLPGLISVHGGNLLISKTHLKENVEMITEALKECPTGALQLSTVE